MRNLTGEVFVLSGNIVIPKSVAHRVMFMDYGRIVEETRLKNSLKILSMTAPNSFSARYYTKQE